MHPREIGTFGGCVPYINVGEITVDREEIWRNDYLMSWVGPSHKQIKTRERDFKSNGMHTTIPKLGDIKS